MGAKRAAVADSTSSTESNTQPSQVKEKSKPPPEPTVPLRKLYTFCSPCEVLLLLIGAVTMTGAGVAQPLMLLAFQNLFQSLGTTETIAGASIPTATLLEILLIMIYIGLGMFAGNLIGVSSVEYVAASSMGKYKQAYLKAVLRQEVGWYDISNPEELSATFAEAMVKIQKGLKSQSMLFMGLGYGIGSGIMAFLPQIGHWEVALVTLAAVPLLIVAAGCVMYFVENGTKTVTNAYGKAGGIATECLFSMRTIASLGIEQKFEGRYTKALGNVRRISIINSSMFMCSAGVALSAYLVMMAVAIIYGCFRLAGEIDASQFAYIVPNPGNGSTHYCSSADADVDIPTHVLINIACPTPFYMSCQRSEAIALAGGTPISSLAAQTPGAENFTSTEGGGDNITFIHTLGFETTDAFTSFVQGAAPAEYMAGRDSYGPCSISGQQMLLAIFAIMMMGEGLSMAGQPMQFMSLARQAAAKVFAIINRVPLIDSFSEEGLKPSSVTGAIEVRDVVFAYPSAPDHLVCKGYTLYIPAGQTCALCGPSGSGKSTIIQLLERFYDPQSGMIALDGADIKTLNVRWLRSQLGLVGQEPVLFQGSVAENIGYGKEGATQAEIEEAAKMANAHAFITESLGDGYKTEVGQGGGKLSGGQKQRVAIARAIVKKPSILLLDEATSALDNESERIVQAALDEIMTKLKRTTVVIAHRLSTIRGSNKIAVLQNGAVIEEGTYESLLGITNGIFAGLAEKQESLLAMDRKSIGHVSVEPSAVPAQASGTGTEVGARGKSSTKAKVKQPKEKAESKPIWRVLSMQSDHAVSLLLLCLFSGGACAMCTWAFYLLVEVMTIPYEPLSDQMRSRAVSMSIQLALWAAGVIGSFTLSGFFNGLASSSLTAKLRTRGIAALMRQEMAFFDQEENSASELSAFLAEKVDKVKTVTTEQLDLVAQALGGCTMFIVLLIIYSDWRILLAWLGFLAAVSVVMPLMAAFMKGEDAVEAKAKKGIEDKSKLGKATASANKIVGDAVMGIRTVASFNLEHRFYASFRASTSEVAYVQKRDAILMGLGPGFSYLTMMSLVGGVFFYSTWLASQGIVGFAAVWTPMFTMMGVMVPMMKMSALADMKNAINAANRLFSVFDRTPTIDNLSTIGQTLSSVTGAIEVRDVVFAYPSAPDHLVCKGYTLYIPAGQTCALCGPSGSGKSTIIQLLERFYDPQSGMIALDGADIKTLNVRWLRSQLGLVGQEPVLFQGSVAENIGYGKEGATQAEIEEAAKMANAHAFITESLGDGYKTDVGLKGGKLSGGQKQRVAIARAIVKKPSILLLDEATSALDNESERIVQAALDEIMTKLKRTTVVIAHRLSTIRGADKIAVVYEGTIAEEGTHDELLANHGMYTNLVLSS